MVIFLMILGSTGISIAFFARENYRHNIKPDLIISTIGDSLTDSGRFGTVIEYEVEIKDCYQYYTYNYLKVRQLETRVRNLGISGQTIRDICARFNSTVPANYMVCMAGTNDVWRANYTTPGIYDILAARIIETYNTTIFNTIAYQESLGHASPVIILCSIPPFGNVSPTFTSIPGAIQHVNAALKAYIQGLNRSDILFCDVYTAMSNDAGWMIDGLYTDGVHFTDAGDQVVGETVAQTIVQHYYHPGV